MVATLHLLRPDYSPLRNFQSEYLVGPFSSLAAAAAYIVAAALLILVFGLRLSVRPSGFLTASCVLSGVTAVSLCVAAAFPLQVSWLPDRSRPILSPLSRTAIIHGVASVLLYASLVALLLTLPSAYKRDEKWRSFSRVTLLLGFLSLTSFVGFILAPWCLRGLAQRGISLPILTWLLLTGLCLRQAVPRPFVKAALLFVMTVTFVIFVASGVFRVWLSSPPPRPDFYLYWGAVVLCFAMGTFSFWRGTVELLAYLRQPRIESSLI